MIRRTRLTTFDKDSNTVSVSVAENQMLMFFGIGNAEVSEIGRIGVQCYLVVGRGMLVSTLQSDTGLLEIFEVTSEGATLQWAANKLVDLRDKSKCGYVDVWIAQGTDKVEIANSGWLNNPALPDPTDVYTGMLRLHQSLELSKDSKSVNVQVTTEQMLMFFGFGNTEFPGVGKIGNQCFLVVTKGLLSESINSSLGVVEIWNVSSEAIAAQWAANKSVQLRDGK